MNRKDWELLVLASAKGEPLSPVQLQKSLFIIGKGLAKFIKKKKFYNFVPYDYGPFDPSVYEDAEELENDGLVTIRKVPGQRWNEYFSTQAGLKRAEKLRKKIPPEVLEYLDTIVEWTRSLSFDQLVRAIYEEFPDYAVYSVFHD